MAFHGTPKIHADLPPGVRQGGVEGVGFSTSGEAGGLHAFWGCQFAHTWAPNLLAIPPPLLKYAFLEVMGIIPDDDAPKRPYRNPVRLVHEFCSDAQKGHTEIQYDSSMNSVRKPRKAIQKSSTTRP